MESGDVCTPCCVLQIKSEENIGMHCLLHPPRVVRFKHSMVGGEICFRLFNFVRFVVFNVLNLAGMASMASLESSGWKVAGHLPSC